MPRKSSIAKKVDPERREKVIVPLSMSSDLDGRIERAAAGLGLSKQDTMRLSIDRGLTVLWTQLKGEPVPA